MSEYLDEPRLQMPLKKAGQPEVKIQREPGSVQASLIEISGLNKWYGQFHVLRDINLTVRKGEKIVICGPSGSGKSTLIRCINCLEEHQEGSIVVD
nr:ATP-binding cassette domain-containing protein [Endozoicomonas sp.]